MYCPNCGTYNEDSYNNCISCGKYIADINKNLRQQTTAATAEQEQSEKTYYAQPEEVKNQAFEVQADSATEESAKAYVPAVAENLSEEKKQTPDKKYYEAIYRQYVKKPKEYFILSVLCTIFGSIGFGIAAIVFSVMTKAEISAGNIKKAGIYSQNTRTFCIFSIVIGVIKYLFIIIMISSYFTTVNYYRSPFMW